MSLQGGEGRSWCSYYLFDSLLFPCPLNIFPRVKSAQMHCSHRAAGCQWMPNLVPQHRRGSLTYTNGPKVVELPSLYPLTGKFMPKGEQVLARVHRVGLVRDWYQPSLGTLDYEGKMCEVSSSQLFHKKRDSIKGGLWHSVDGARDGLDSFAINLSGSTILCWPLSFIIYSLWFHY